MEAAADRSWKRNVAVVWVAVVIAIMGMSLVIPFLPLYLAELGVEPSGTRLWAGWIGGANFLFAALFAPLWGHLADRYGRKRMALRALVGLAVSAGLMGFAQNVWQLLALRILQGMFGGFVAEAIALVGTSVPRDRTGSALGFLQTGVVAGNFVGPLVGAALSHFFGYRATFRLTGAALVAAMLLILFLVRETRPPEPEERKSVAAGVRDLWRLPLLRWLVVTVLCSQCALMLVNPQISLFVQELAPAGGVDWWTGVVSAAPALSSCVMAPLWGRLGDRRGHAGVLSWALLGAAVCAPWAAAAGAAWHLMAVRLAMGGFTSALNPSNHSLAAHSVEPARLAGAFSLVSSAQMLGSCVGPFASGPLAATFGIRALFPLTALLLLAASFGAARIRRLQRG
jgi:DHA1 family multidrug resistance protein-like MFS transporter